ncbi:hypothetical protein BDK51DRAFT_26006 [Blyttiomyces helicus]|uniref:Uncharacterized protein n=1 Tax=Blyttiomyces helicus TaxID=388810 RepID=A0A4P9W4A0_9FUNG|nr:hypothetical protein BDK51DRAFT_26006 [Blyttiomyces helicus]|eukprot:RKO86712.1 hypothetical protein BDK51DRAFT_26006 [Blyttiomyces helicus]
MRGDGQFEEKTNALPWVCPDAGRRVLESRKFGRGEGVCVDDPVCQKEHEDGPETGLSLSIPIFICGLGSLTKLSRPRLAKVLERERFLVVIMNNDRRMGQMQASDPCSLLQTRNECVMHVGEEPMAGQMMRRTLKADMFGERATNRAQQKTEKEKGPMQPLKTTQAKVELIVKVVRSIEVQPHIQGRPPDRSHSVRNMCRLPVVTGALLNDQGWKTGQEGEQTTAFGGGGWTIKPKRGRSITDYKMLLESIWGEISKEQDSWLFGNEQEAVYEEMDRLLDDIVPSFPRMQACLMKRPVIKP